MIDQTHRTVVLGGGVLGVSTATHLAEAGGDVLLVTESGLASGASGRSLSWLNSAARRSPEYHLLRVLGIDRYRTLSARVPASAAWLRFDGAISWGGPEGAERVRELFEYQRSIGYDAHWVGRDEASSLVPGVDGDALPEEGATWNPGEGWVDLPSLMVHLAERFTAAGGRVVLDAGPAAVIASGSRVDGVRLGDGTVVPADSVLVATGAAVPDMLEPLGIRVPDRTPVSFLVRADRVASPLRAVMNTPRASLRPTPDGGLAVDSGWAEAEIEAGPNGTYRPAVDLADRLLAEASAVLAGHPRLTARSVHVGRKPIPMDGEPVLGRVGTIDGLYAAFTHSGATLALIVGELIADEIATGRPHPLLSTFRATRFSRAGALA